MLEAERTTAMSSRRSGSSPARLAKEREMPRSRSRNEAHSDLAEDIAAVGGEATGEGDALDLEPTPSGGDAQAAATSGGAAPSEGSPVRAAGVIRRPAAGSAAEAPA
ncbi:MAG: hypothetical protein AB1689_25260, partial [Thermodesulfobacteriota bacterium]